MSVFACFEKKSRPKFPGAALAMIASLAGVAFGWSASGTVKDTSGTLLSGVAVTVKDSSLYSATTDASGAFTIGSSTTGLLESEALGSLSAQVSGGELVVRSSQDGPVRAWLYDVSGRALWRAASTVGAGESRIALPSGLREGASYLRVVRGQSEIVLGLIGGPDGWRATTHLATSRALATSSYPTLVFNKSGYRDTTYAMTADATTGIVAKMVDTSKVCSLPSTISWTSSDSLVGPKDSYVYAVKDPTIQYYNGKWLVYATAADTVSGSTHWDMEFISFSSFDSAKYAKPTYMRNSAELGGYYCAPELFYFASKKLWYLTYQWGAMYSTTTTPDDPSSWSSPASMFTLATGQDGIDYYPICDKKNCYVFFTGDDGYLYRKSTTVANFPTGWGSVDTVVLGGAKYHGKDTVYEGGSTYKLRGLNKYLTLIEGTGSGWTRIFSAWIADSLNGKWTPAFVGYKNPFAGAANVTYATGVSDWTNDVSHGELLRYVPDGTHADETQTVDACHLQLLYQGVSPSASYSGYIKAPYRLGLLTAK